MGITLKVHFKKSVLEQLNSCIDKYTSKNILNIELTRDEYISLLEDLDMSYNTTVSRFKKYKDVSLIIVP